MEEQIRYLVEERNSLRQELADSHRRHNITCGKMLYLSLELKKAKAEIERIEHALKIALQQQH